MANTFETGYRSTLSAKLNSTDTTLSVATAPTVTAGRMHLYKGNTHAWIKYTGVSGNTLTGVTFVSQTSDPSISVTGTTFPAGTSIELVSMHDQMIDKQDPTASLQIGTIYATTTARDSALGGNGVATLPYVDIYVTATGLYYNYNLSTNQWESVDTGTPVGNASTTVAGIVEMATQTEVNNGTAIGGTGAQLVVGPDTLKVRTDSILSALANDTRLTQTITATGAGTGAPVNYFSAGVLMPRFGGVTLFCTSNTGNPVSGGVETSVDGVSGWTDTIYSVTANNGGAGPITSARVYVPIQGGLYVRVRTSTSASGATVATTNGILFY